MKKFQNGIAFSHPYIDIITGDLVQLHNLLLIYKTGSSSNILCYLQFVCVGEGHMFP
jgi:hypothetical protein